MVIHKNARSVLDKIDKFIKLKASFVGNPDVYLGAKLRKVRLENDVMCWSVSPSKYVQEAVRNCQSYLKANFPEDSDFALI